MAGPSVSPSLVAKMTSCICPLSETALMSVMSICEIGCERTDALYQIQDHNSRGSNRAHRCNHLGRVQKLPRARLHRMPPVFRILFGPAPTCGDCLVLILMGTCCQGPSFARNDGGLQACELDDRASFSGGDHSTTRLTHKLICTVLTSPSSGSSSPLPVVPQSTARIDGM
jgi:hypothetical protein